MTSAIKKSLSALTAILSIGAGVLLSQSKQADGPRLYRVWSDAQGDTHLEEIDITTKGRPVIPGVVVNFPGAVTGPNGPRGGEQLHNTSVRQFAVTVFGQIDVQTSDGTRAHLRTGDMSFVEDVTGKGHRTFETGSQSVFLRVPEGFDVNPKASM